MIKQIKYKIISSALFIFVSLFVIAGSDTNAFAEEWDMEWVKVENIIAQFDALQILKANEDKGLVLENGAVLLTHNMTITLPISLPKDKYNIAISYKPIKGVIAKSSIIATVGDFTGRCPIQSVWTDKTKDYETDRYGNQVLPDQIALDQRLWHLFHS